MKGFSLFPTAASTGAQSVDVLFWALMGLSLCFAVPICGLLILFSVKYRHGRKVDRSNPPAYNRALEAAWILTPTVLGICFFVWAAKLYYVNSRPPADALDVYVVAKQWMWKLQHPSGRREIDELHVPVGRAIRLTMTSEDVIHDFFVPAFRVKQDVLPGRYTTMWFTPTRVGRYHLFCAEYCGTFHSRMGGWVYVMKPADYARWLTQGDAQPVMTSSGQKLFQNLGCSGCHGDSSSVRAPSLDGIYNKPVAIQDGASTRVILADDTYLHDSIVQPEKDIAAGYQPLMPSYKGRISEEEMLQIVAYLKTLGQNPTLSQKPNALNAGKNGDAAATKYMHSWVGNPNAKTAAQNPAPSNARVPAATATAASTRGAARAGVGP